MDSIGLNLSEGYARMHAKERRHFYSIATGSLEEAMFCLHRARDRGLMRPNEAWVFAALLIKLGKAIQNFAEAEKPSQ